jgi:hypothetical protein
VERLTVDDPRVILVEADTLALSGEQAYAVRRWNRRLGRAFARAVASRDVTMKMAKR